MPSVRVTVPADLYEHIKSRHIDPSAVFIAWLREEFHRQDLLSETGSYLADLRDEVGEPVAEGAGEEDALADAMKRHLNRVSGPTESEFLSETSD